MRKSTRLAALGAGLALPVAAVAVIFALRGEAAADPIQATLYKNPQCACCEGHADHLRANGFAVEVIESHDLAMISRDAGVPEAFQGCHTTVIDGYVVDGHVPADIVLQMLAERPAIAGITLPGMPTGSPGMGGPKTGPFTVYSVTDADQEPVVYAVE
ncbi:MAG: DUF411 domain-containing protein [Alphaproteobacteria bacterium]